MTMCAAGIAAPLGSMTRPAIAPVGAWPRSVWRAIRPRMRVSRVIFCTPHTVCGLWGEGQAAQQVGVAGIRPHWVEPHHAYLDIGHERVACLIGLFKPVKGLVCPAKADTQLGDQGVV